ncbi:hypothetical protein IG631_18768 [Alternaria alternata]|nr:hypothetical protein IG631_18768 [Alternaria alternata]
MLDSQLTDSIVGLKESDGCVDRHDITTPQLITFGRSDSNTEVVTKLWIALARFTNDWRIAARTSRLGCMCVLAMRRLLQMPDLEYKQAIATRTDYCMIL